MKIAVITDIHGNLEALTAILNDINEKSIDKIICLGDTIGIGIDSKKCLDIIIDNNIDMVLGNHELYCIRGTKIDSSIVGEEKQHHEWIRKSLGEKEINFIKTCPLKYEYELLYDDEKFNRKYVFSHYLISDINANYPFEREHLNNDINLWKKYNSQSITYIIGHLHTRFDVNEVDGILGDYIEDLNELTNIEIVPSSGCSFNNEVSYMMIEINKGINIKNIMVKYDRDKFINKMLEEEFPDKKNILKYFYGIDL